MTITWKTPSGTTYPLYREMLSEPHLLIAGATGSGKSTLLHGLIHEILMKSPSDRAMYLCDPKRVELAMYKDLPQCYGFGNDPSSILKVLQEVHSVMQERFKAMEKARQRETTANHIYVIVDEFADLIVSGGRDIEALIESIGKLGRAAHVHLILATQAPSRKTLKANITLNLTGRVALRCDSSIESRQIIGQPGAETLPRHGDFLYKNSEGIAHYRGFPVIPEEELDRVISHWERQNRTWKKTAKWCRLW